MRASSQAVRRAPWSSGRVSSGSASSSRPRACTSPITPSAVPRSTAASAPVLQMVMIRIRGRATSSRTRSAPRTAIAPQAAMSSSRIASASARTAAGPSGSRASARSVPQARLTAVGRAARSLAAPSRTAASSPGVRGRQERHAHGPGDAQRRGATDREPDDGVDEVVERRDPEDDELVGEAGLVDEADLALDPVDGAVAHGGHCTGRRAGRSADLRPRGSRRHAVGAIASRSSEQGEAQSGGLSGTEPCAA